MSHWSTDESLEKSAMNPEADWKVNVTKIENLLKKMKQDANNTAQKFIWIKTNGGSYEVLITWTHNITHSCVEVMQSIDNLEKMIPKRRDMEQVARANQVKQLAKRAETEIKHIQNLSTEIHTEMEKNYLKKKMAASMSLEVTGTLDQSKSRASNQYQMAALEESRMEAALEDERRCKKLMDDVTKLQEIFTKVSQMIHEQGEVVEHIAANVELAYENVEEGTKKLSQAVTYRDSAMKKMLCIIGVVLIVLAVVIIIIVVSVMASKK